MSKLSSLVKQAKASTGPTGEASHLVVKARAGTGKTFTLVLALAYCFRKSLINGKALWDLVRENLGFEPFPSPQQQAVWEAVAQEPPHTVTYLAFNKSIVEEFSTKYRWLVQALASVGCSLSFSTLHSMGFKACMRAYGISPRGIEKNKTRILLEEWHDEDIRELERHRSTYVKAVVELVRLCKINLVRQPLQSYVHNITGAEWEEILDGLCSHYDVDLGQDREDIYLTVPEILERAAGTTDTVDFDDMIWLPVANGLSVYQNELLLVDEAQDLNRCQQALARKAGSHIVLCGDEAQAIYGFAGADVDSIPRMQAVLSETDRGCDELSLTVTRRCGKRIVEEVRHLVPDFEAHEGNPEGIIRSIPNDPQFEHQLQDKDFVLCRVNAPLVSLAFHLLRQGRKANIQGRDIGEGLKGLITRSRRKTVDDLLEWLDTYLSSETARLRKRKHVPEEALVALADKVACLRCVCEGATSIREVTSNIDKVFSGKQCPQCRKSYGDDATACFRCKIDLVKPEGVLLSSVHRAKGLEASRVYILRPELLPHPMAKSAWQRQQEHNLRYVAITRAIEELIYVTTESE